jgi:hypothetical protein
MGWDGGILFSKTLRGNTRFGQERLIMMSMSWKHPLRHRATAKRSQLGEIGGFVGQEGSPNLHYKTSWGRMSYVYRTVIISIDNEFHWPATLSLFKQWVKGI